MYHRYLIEAGIEMRESATSTYHLINKSSTWSLTLLLMGQKNSCAEMLEIFR